METKGSLPKPAGSRDADTDVVKTNLK